MTPKEAYQHAVEHGPSDDTRAAACQDPEWAYRYAYYVDRAPHDDTRAGACQDPGRAYYYALDVDRAPRPDTRAAACGDPEGAYYYALDVDRAPHPDTRAAVERTEYQSRYEERFGGFVKHDTDKPGTGLLPPAALLEVAEVLSLGAEKYTPDNWRRSPNVRRYPAAALRHLLAYLTGEDADQETGKSHLAHAAASCLFQAQIDLDGRPGQTDDRIKKGAR